MAWNAGKFDNLIEKTEKIAHKNIRYYRLQVTLFAILGYSYLFILTAFLLSPIIFLTCIYSFNPYKNVWGWLAIILGCLPLFFFIFPIMKSLRVLIYNGSPPDGKYLNRNECPQLFELIDELTIKLKITPFKNVILTDDFNAYVSQVAKLGIFGWYDNYLILGIPIMASLSYDEFRSVLVHEIGHIAGNHSRFCGWILRLRVTLSQMVEHIEQVNEGHPSIFITPFVKWYIPFFDAYSFVLTRINEYDADKLVLQLTGAETYAISLIKYEVASRFINYIFWHNIYQQVEYQPKPPGDTYTQLITALSNSNTFQDNYHYLQQALAYKTNNVDSHPSLTQRLKNLGYKSFPKSILHKCIAPANSAAELLLNKKLPEFILDLNRQWEQQIESSWRQRYAVLQEALQEIATLSTQGIEQKLNIEDNWKLACLYLELNKIELTGQKLSEIIEDNPTHVDAHYLLGQVLLREGNPDGVKHLEKALKLDESLAGNSLNLLYQFFWERGEVKKANRYRDRLDNFYYQLNQAKRERSIINDKDEFCYHNLEISEIKILKAQISKFPRIKEAYIVQKKVDYFSKIPFFVLGVVRYYRVFNLEFDDVSHKLTISLKNTLQIPGDWEVLVAEYSDNNIIDKMRQIKQSRIC